VEDNVQTDEVLMGDNLSSYKMECHSQHGRGGPRLCPYVGIVRNRQSRLIRGLAR
jgi:hypothetical protein